MKQGKQRSEQARVLRKRLLRRMVLCLLGWTIAFIGLFLLVNLNSAEIGTWIADNTSAWSYFDEDSEFAKRLRSKTEHLYGAVAVAGDPQTQTVYDDLAKGPLYLGTNIQFTITPEGEYAIRDITIYNAFKSAKIPIALLIYALGVMVIVIVTLNTSLRYFDDLAQAVGAPGLVEGKKPELPRELSIASQQLELLQIRMRDHEQSAVLAEQRKNELVAYLAHDIRTPLTSVIGYLSLLVESPDLPIEKRAEYAGIALAKAERLEKLVEEFFEITRYNLDSIVLERETVDVALFVEQVVDEFGVTAQARTIEIESEAPQGESVFMDPHKMARVLGNVLKNAIAYAETGSTVKIMAAVVGDDLVIKITDKGREISPVHLERIFERFYREDGSRSQSENAGLGLAIAREIVEAHNGSIKAESSEGMTTFTIRIPK